MQPRQDVIEIFSTFLRLESDRVTGWIADRRLQRSMAAAIQVTDVPTASPQLWALHWHHSWQTSPLAAAHLSAYLQETCYWVAAKMARNQRQVSWVADLFQVAILRVPKLLQNFNPQYSASLKKYAELGFENSLKDWLRVQQQVEVCSDWALLYRLSRKRLGSALQGAGWSPVQIGQATLAWDCFQELTAVNQTGINALGRPNDSTWQAIALAYNTERFSQAGAAASNPEQIEQWLLTCARLVRQFLKPGIVSADAPRLGQESGSQMDDLVDENPSPIGLLLQQEEDATRQQYLGQLQRVLSEALTTLSPPEIALLQQYYRDHLTQTDIAHQQSVPQYQVSRDLKRIRKAMLKKVAQWSQETLHIPPSASVVDAMSTTVEEWLRVNFKGDGEVEE
jgi:RNA polymerase sigma factor (sigma-70 family)